MKKPMIVFALMVLAAAIAFAGEYNRRVSVTGASPQRVSTLMNTAGYNGTMLVDEWTACNSGAATVYIGQNNVSASNGFALASGDCKTERKASVGIDLTQKYLYVASTQNVDISLRSQ